MWSTLRRFMLPVVALAMTTAVPPTILVGTRLRGSPRRRSVAGSRRALPPPQRSKRLLVKGSSAASCRAGQGARWARQAARPEASAETRQQGTPFCWLSPAKGGQAVLGIGFVRPWRSR